MTEVILFGLEGCDDCNTQKDILDRMPEIAYAFHSISDPNSMSLVEQHGVDDIPTLIIDVDGKVFRYEGILATHKIAEAIEFLRRK
jgi:glutaredoxin